MNDAIRDTSLHEALDWAARVQSDDFDAWEAHIDWLEADPAHPLLYRRAASALSAGLATFQQIELEPIPVPANDADDHFGTHLMRKGWWVGASAALAASITAFFVLPYRTSEPERVIQTAPGINRSVTLAGGTSLILNGDTQVKVAGEAQRRVVLQRGEIFLRVAHDAERPFEVLAGERVFQDIGTEFNVSIQTGTTRLTVAEGAVALDPKGANLRINAGHAVSITGAEVVMDEIASRNVGSWREGRLVYANDRLDRVTSDLSRSLGVSVVAAPELANTRFTGVLPIRKGSGEVVHRLANLLDASAVKTGSGWSINVKSARDRLR